MKLLSKKELQDKIKEILSIDDGWLLLNEADFKLLGENVYYFETQSPKNIRIDKEVKAIIVSFRTTDIYEEFKMIEETMDKIYFQANDDCDIIMGACKTFDKFKIEVFVSF